MKQYLYIDSSDYGYCCPNIDHYADIIRNKQYNESELIELDEFRQIMESFGLLLDGRKYVTFCNILERMEDSMIRNIIIMVRLGG